MYILALAGLPYQLVSSPVFRASIRRKSLEPGSDFVAVSQVWRLSVLFDAAVNVSAIAAGSAASTASSVTSRRPEPISRARMAVSV
jgi:hypothetical protein